MAAVMTDPRGWVIGTAAFSAGARRFYCLNPDNWVSGLTQQPAGWPSPPAVRRPTAPVSAKCRIKRS